MPEPFDRDDLDAVARACEAEPDASIVLSGRCHPGAPSTWRVETPGAVVVACAACSRLFARLELDPAAAVEPLHRHPECGPGSGPAEVRLSYAPGSGLVRVACAGCGGPLGAFPILRRSR
jgi:hypothetical protein